MIIDEREREGNKTSNAITRHSHFKPHAQILQKSAVWFAEVSLFLQVNTILPWWGIIVNFFPTKIPPGTCLCLLWGIFEHTTFMSRMISGFTMQQPGHIRLCVYQIQPIADPYDLIWQTDSATILQLLEENYLVSSGDRIIYK